MAMQSQALNGGAMMSGAIGDIFNVGSAIGEYKRSQEQGDDGIISVAKGVGNFAWGEFYYGGVSRLVNERKFIPGYDFGQKAFGLMSAGQVAGGIGKGIGIAIGGTVGGVAGGGASILGGLFGVNGAGKALGAGAKLGAKIGGVAGSMAGTMVPVMALTMGAQLVSQLPQVWENNARVMTQAYRQRGKLGSGYFEMSQAGYTMRQRSLNAIRQNGLNTQTALGNEARMYFRGSGIDE